MDPPELEVLAGRMAIESAEMEDLASEPSGKRDSVGDVSAAAWEDVEVVVISTRGSFDERGGPPPRRKAPSPTPFIGGSSPSRRRSWLSRARFAHSKSRFFCIPHFQKAMKLVIIMATMNGNHAPVVNLFHVAITQKRFRDGGLQAQKTPSTSPKKQR